MRRVLLLLAFISSGTLAGAAEPVRPALVRYEITAQLDTSRKTIRGRETIRWRNGSDVAVDILPFHFYLNAFRPKSTFSRESGSSLRNVRGGTDGGVEITSLSCEGRDLLPGLRFIAPDDGNVRDKTLAEVPLGRAVAPGEEIRIEIRFVSKLPRAYARTGWAGNFYLAGQWYPKPAVLEPAGVRGRPEAGFNRHQFHAHSEFYGEFADFDVTLDVPSGYVVGATGMRTSEQLTADRRITRWSAENVHDFAWVASPDLIEHVFRFDPVRDVPPEWRSRAAQLLGVPPADLRLSPVEVRLLMQPSNEEMTERYRRAAFSTLAWAGLRLGSYPWPSLTIVDPPADALGTGGMEYPTFVTALTHPSLGMWPFSSISKLPETVVVHEVAHQWFYGLLASNEFEESWLDEGLTSWVEAEVVDAMFPEGSTRPMILPSITSVAMNRLALLRAQRKNLDPIVRRAWEYEGSYAYNSYQRPALAVFQIEAMVGESLFARAMREYVDDFAWKHPGTGDFLATFERVTEADLSALRRHVFFGNGHFDHLVRSVETREDGTGHWESTVTVARNGALPMGAVVRLFFADGTVRDAAYPTEARWIRWRAKSRSALVRVAVDPDHRNVLESDKSNNSEVLEGRGPWPRGAALRSVAIVSHLLRMVVAGW